MAAVGPANRPSRRAHVEGNHVVRPRQARVAELEIEPCGVEIKGMENDNGRFI